ncbi:MAG: sensor domain-containing diguanylate cyclase, partial [Verrucomicrobiaceae bacterium]
MERAVTGHSIVPPLVRLGVVFFGLTAASAWLLQITGVPVLWPAAGLLIAWMAAYPARKSPPAFLMCFASGFLVLLIFDWTPGSAALLMGLSLAEAYFAYELLSRLRDGKIDWLDRVDGFLTFVATMGIASAIFAIPVSMVSGPTYTISTINLWVAWSVAVSLGTLTVTPIAWLTYTGRLRQDWLSDLQTSRVTTVVVIFTVALTTAVTFAQSKWPILFLPFLPLVIGAFKAGRSGTLLSILVFSDVAIIATEMGYGPIAAIAEASPFRFLMLQIYLGVAFLTVFPAALEFRERRLVTQDLHAAIASLSESEQRAQSLAYRDPLTSLANRRCFLDHLEQACDEKTAITLAIIDLNEFKIINDRWGHSAGDYILQVAAYRFTSAVNSEVLIARLGGDEFAVLATGSIAAAPEDFGKQLVAALEEPIEFERRDFPVSCACGVARSEMNEPRTPTSLLAQADIAMYVAKAAP